jgi:hypothetical protein
VRSRERSLLVDDDDDEPILESELGRAEVLEPLLLLLIDDIEDRSRSTSYICGKESRIELGVSASAALRFLGSRGSVAAATTPPPPADPNGIDDDACRGAAAGCWKAGIGICCCTEEAAVG